MTSEADLSSLRRWHERRAAHAWTRALTELGQEHAVEFGAWREIALRHEAQVERLSAWAE